MLSHPVQNLSDRWGLYAELLLHQKVNWPADAEIVIAPSGFDAAEMESAVINSTSGNSLTLSSPLHHTHYGEAQAALVADRLVSSLILLCSC